MELKDMKKAFLYMMKFVDLRKNFKISEQRIGTIPFYHQKYNIIATRLKLDESVLESMKSLIEKKEIDKTHNSQSSASEDHISQMHDYRFGESISNSPLPSNNKIYFEPSDSQFGLQRPIVELPLEDQQKEIDL